MTKFTLLIFLVLANGQRIIFMNQCLPKEECPTLTHVTDFSKIESCGQDRFICPPEDETVCDCWPVNQCRPFKALLDARNFKELQKQRSCGYDGLVPKYCCPLPKIENTPEIEEKNAEIDLEKPKNTTPFTTNSPISVSPRLAVRIEDICGTMDGITLRIFGGFEAEDHEFPWMAGLVYETKNGNSKVFCGGVLLTSNVVLTAAHCIQDYLGYSLTKVKLGHANLSLAIDIPVEINTITIHPKYEKTPLGPLNDIAIMQLSQRVDFDETILPICLPETGNLQYLENAEDSNLIVSGWGATEEIRFPDILLMLSLKFVTKSNCESQYAEAGIPNFQLAETQLCAQGPFLSDSCQGDSGGPLFRENLKTGRTELIGITSFGTRRCDSGIPGVYVNVGQYLDWINDFIDTVEIFDF